MVAERKSATRKGGKEMNRYKIEAGSLYYKNELVAAFIPKINGIDVLHDCVTDVYTYKRCV